MSDITSITKSAKAYVALVGSVATALLGVFGPETPVGQALVVVVALATALATYKVPNADSAPEGEFGDDIYLDGHGS